MAQGDTAKAIGWYEEAFAVAQAQGMRMVQLQASTRLAQAQGSPERVGRLREVLASFTEARDYPLLQEVAAVLAS